MVDDIDELFVEQPRIDRVQHPAHPRGAVPAHQMMTVVHRQRRDAVALFHSELDHRGGEAARVDADLAPGRSRHAAIGPARDDLSRRMFRSEEHTSELQSLMRISYAVLCLKKKKRIK